MMMRTSIILAALVTSAYAETPTGLKVMEGVENRDDGKDMLATVTMQIKPKKGTERLRKFTLMRKEFKDVTKMVTFIQAPTDVRGSAFLVSDRRGAEDLRWLYLPSIGQVRALSADSNRQSFFGSDFVYEDLTNRDPDLDEHKLVGTQKVDEWECWVIESTPKQTRGLNFTKYKTWVWKTGEIVVRQEYYDAAGKLTRRGQVHSIKQVQDIWTWHQGTMEDVKAGSTTRLQISDVKYNSDVADERFAESQLSRGAPK